MDDFFEKLAALRRDGQSFAVATVVGRRPPVSAHLGDRALVFADGRMEGFVGGACSREIVRKHALASIASRRALLVSIRPDATQASTSDPEHIVVPMTCVSEGAVDVYVEPFVPARRLVVVGTTPVAEALTRIGLSLDYEVVRVVDEAEQRDLQASASAPGLTVARLESLESVLKNAPDAAAVVASQGHYDEQALEAILKYGAAYVGLVASRKRGAAVLALLTASGVAGVESVRNPAGLDLGARTAPEVALSILAEIVQLGPSRSQTRSRGGVQAAPASPPATTAVDPVCRMDVEIATARHTTEVGGTMYYFCCAQCRTRFASEPARYLESHA
ncbi:MAG TPA: XdhC family protein [Vicinamibacterales bacterium]|nr:XdhC family protein [Vicinamibacterales bacterium]